jgi:hypothetical protein
MGSSQDANALLTACWKGLLTRISASKQQVAANVDTTENRSVGGSIPPLGTISPLAFVGDRPT